MTTIAYKVHLHFQCYHARLHLLLRKTTKTVPVPDLFCHSTQKPADLKTIFNKLLPMLAQDAIFVVV